MTHNRRMGATGFLLHERLRWIDVTRGFAVLLVVFYHVVIAFAVTKVTAPAWASTLNGALSPFRIPTLMFCSGMLLARSLAKPARHYVSGKVRNIGWPWLVWTSVIVVVLIGGSQAVGDGNYGIQQIWQIVTDSRTYTWYLAHLLLYYLIALVVPARIRTVSIPVLILMSALIDDGDGWTRLAFLLGFFFLGDAVTRHHDLWLRLVRRRRVLLLAALAVAITAFASSRMFLRYEPVTAIGVIGLAILAEPLGNRIAKTLVGRGLAVVGRNSIVFYTTHWVVVTVFVHVLVLGRVSNGAIILAALMALGLAVPALMEVLRRRSWLVSALYTWPQRWPARGRQSAWLPSDGTVLGRTAGAPVEGP